jgi:hypothetical protein
MGYDQDQVPGQPQGQPGQTGQPGQPGQPSGQPGSQPGGQAGQLTAQAPGRGYAAAGRDYQASGRHATDHRGAAIAGTALAGTLMLLSGLWMVVVAIVALSHGHVFSPAAAYTFRYNIRGWGWTELALGVVIFAAGMCVFLGMAWARYVGAFIAVLSAIANFVFIPYQPVWSIIMIALDAFIIWALLSPRQYAREV